MTDTEYLRKRAGESNDGNLAGPALQAADRIDALEESNARWQRISRENHEAFAAMRNDLNEMFPIQSDEADLLEGPEMAVSCEAIVRAAREFVSAQKKTEAVANDKCKCDPYFHEYFPDGVKHCRSCDAEWHPAPAQPAAQVSGRLRAHIQRLIYAGDQFAAYDLSLGNATTWATDRARWDKRKSDALSALASPTNADAAQVTEGYVLVPVEPTEAMIFAGHHQIDWCRDKQNTHQPEHPSQTDGGGTSCKEDILDAWKAMLTAARAGEDGR